MSRKSLPPGMKISFWVGRSAPPDSTSATEGSRFSSAICEARKIFRTVHGFDAPPFTVGSFAVIMHSTPSITPMPVTTLAPTVKSEPQPASGESSRNAEPGSISSSIRSRGSSLPRAWWRSTYFSPPPATAFATSTSSSAIFVSIELRRSSLSRSVMSVHVELGQQALGVVDHLEEVLVVLDHLAAHVDPQPLLVHEGLVAVEED